jgi:hypothetical protein
MDNCHQVRCVKKNDRYNPWERIKTIGGLNSNGSNWSLSQEEAITGIEDGKWCFFVEKYGTQVKVIVAKSRFGNKYLKTIADGEEPNNLLNLPECYN